MSEPDWKQKYRDSLLELESGEQRWRQTEQALRRLVGRLCAAGMGVHSQLDDELVLLAAANRRNADAVELDKLAESLTGAVVAVDAVAPVPAATLPTRWEATAAAVGRVLRHLRTVGVPGEVAGELIALLTQARTDPELAAVLDRTTDLVAAHGETLAAERLKAAAILSDVTQRLTEMSGYLTESGDAARSRFADTAAVNDDVIGQVRELTVEVNSATDLHVLQSTVCARLEAVSKQVMELRSREEIRLQEQTGRAERMRTRISDLERETQDLHSKLDQEKHGARLDPLTRLANRKSFDERFGQEVELCSQGRLSLTLLLWDIDNFKRINDTYGHRAGDRVLQSVGTCFLSGLRAEDFVARIGGEEFVVLLTGVPFARALTIADELRIGVSTLRFHFRGTPVKVTVSCGLTEVRPGDTGGVAFDRADKALYKAKNAGKNLCLPS